MRPGSNFIRNSITDKINIEISTSIIGRGDFNLHLYTFLDADRKSPKLKVNSLSKLISMIKGNELNCIFCIRYPYSRQFTWRCNNLLMQRRLDYFLISDSLQQEIGAINITPPIQSNHLVIKMKLSSLQEIKQGPSHWKFNPIPMVVMEGILHTKFL